nr:sugar nucleotide-binding protein [Pseudomonadota bacterium]
YYEPGLWDIRGPQPRPTALVRAASDLAEKGKFDHPVLDRAGWWRRSSRLHYPAFELPRSSSHPSRLQGSGELRHPPRKLLITGGNGALRSAFATQCVIRGLEYCVYDYAALYGDAGQIPPRHDGSRAGSLRVLDIIRPWAVIDVGAGLLTAKSSAALAGARDDAAAQAGPPMTITESIARYCSEKDARLMVLSSDTVFDGYSYRPYFESDEVGPSTSYGQGQAASEARISAALPDSLIVRTSAFFGPHNARGWLGRAVRALHRDETVMARSDLLVSMTYVPDLVEAALDLLIDAEKGIWHLANSGTLSRYEMGILAAKMIGTSSNRIASMEPVYTIPRYHRALGSERGIVMRSFDDALRHYIAKRAHASNANDPERHYG